MAKISIIVPAYNAEQYIEKCILSLINQTLKDIEIIIINDGSNDETKKIITSFKDSRIHYFSQQNIGIGKTRNKGIKLSTGEYIAFLDSDDYFDNSFCEKMYKKASNSKCDIVICDYYYSKNNKIEKVKVNSFKDFRLIDSPNILKDINFGPCNKIYKRKFIQENKILFDEKLKYEDVPFVAKAIEKATKIGKIDESLCFFTIHFGSQTSTRDNQIFDIFKIVNNLNSIFQNEKYLNFRNYIIVNLLINYMIQTKYINDRKTKKKFLKMSYHILEDIPNYKQYIQNYSNLEKVILNNKLLLKLYCYIF